MILIFDFVLFSSLSASNVNSRHDDIVTSDGCSASYMENHKKKGLITFRYHIIFEVIKKQFGRLQN